MVYERRRTSLSSIGGRPHQSDSLDSSGPSGVEIDGSGHTINLQQHRPSLSGSINLDPESQMHGVGGGGAGEQSSQDRARPDPSLFSTIYIDLTNTTKTLRKTLAFADDDNNNTASGAGSLDSTTGRSIAEARRTMRGQNNNDDDHPGSQAIITGFYA